MKATDDTSAPAAAGPVLSEVLGPLPEPEQTSYVIDGAMRRYEVRSYTADQMFAYAGGAVARAVALMLSEPTDEAIREGLRACCAGDSGPHTLHDWRTFYLAVARHGV